MGKNFEERNLHKMRDKSSIDTTVMVEKIRDSKVRKIEKEGILGTEYGSIKFNAWREVDFEEGNIIQIHDAYLKKFRGEMNLNINEGTEVKILVRFDRDKLKISTSDDSSFSEDKKIIDGGDTLLPSDLESNNDNEASLKY